MSEPFKRDVSRRSYTGDADRAISTIERTLDLLDGWTDLNEFKHTSVPF